MQTIGASQDMALLLLRGCTDVDVFRTVVVVVDAAGLCSAMIVIFSVVNVCFKYPILWLQC
jgi:hypothetical protein